MAFFQFIGDVRGPFMTPGRGDKIDSKIRSVLRDPMTSLKSCLFL